MLQMTVNVDVVDEALVKNGSDGTIIVASHPSYVLLPQQIWNAFVTLQHSVGRYCCNTKKNFDTHKH